MKLRDDAYTCLLYDNPPEETVEHLFFECAFCRTCWRKLGIEWAHGGNRLQLVHEARDKWTGPMFMEIFVIAAWSVWKEHNNKHFRGLLPSVDGWLLRFKNDFGLMRHRVREALVPFVECLVTSI